MLDFVGRRAQSLTADFPVIALNKRSGNMASLEVTLREISPFEDAVREEVGRLAENLERFYPGIMNCRVAVEAPHRHRSHGRLFRANITLYLPHRNVVVSHEHPLDDRHEDIFVALHHAFDAARRKLEDYARLERGDVKDHDLLPHGVVSRIFPDKGYGFITGAGGGEVYFHRNSVLDGFDNLKEGIEVRFEEEQGEKGPQASTVKILRKAHAHHRRH